MKLVYPEGMVQQFTSLASLDDMRAERETLQGRILALQGQLSEVNDNWMAACDEIHKLTEAK
jgi:hypothetical protein